MIAATIAIGVFRGATEDPSTIVEAQRNERTFAGQIAPAGLEEPHELPIPEARHVPAPSPRRHAQNRKAPEAPDVATAAPIARSELVRWLNENPLSDAPHEVLNAWGGPPGSAGPVGLNIVVDSELPSAELERLVMDLRREYQSAEVLSTLVYDSEEAATYDRHIDGGAMASRHVVARVVRDEALEVDRIQVRGQIITP